MSFDIILYQADPIRTDEIATAWESIGVVTAYDDYVVVEATDGRLFVHLNNLLDRPDCLAGVDDEELQAIRNIVEPVYNFNIQAIAPELLNEGFLKFPTSGSVAVDNDNGFIGTRETALELARQGTGWLRKIT